MTTDDGKRIPRYPLVAARRVLEGETHIETIGEWREQPGSAGWDLEISIRLDHSSKYISAITNWFVLVEDHYPLGSVGIYPSKTGGLVHTFPHQSRNDPGSAEVPWRLGKLCLDILICAFSRAGLENDPIGDAEARLRWHVHRGLAWLEAAVENRLLDQGDPFELPILPATSSELWLVHDEGASTFTCWRDCSEDIGVVVLGGLPPANKVIATMSFESQSGEILRRGQWSVTTSATEEKSWTGIWWRWPLPVILEPWKAPATWGDLRALGKRTGVDVDKALRKIAKQLRGRDAPILLIGYPIPQTVGGPDVEMHWQGIFFPKSDAEGPVPKGHRRNEMGYWHRDRQGVLASGNKLNYIKTDNWHPDRLQARGRFSEPITSARCTVVGVGTVGSMLAELLARGGVRHLRMVDNDKLSAGNLVRHVLTLADVGKLKVEAMARRLAAVNPFIEAIPLAKRLPSTQKEVEELLAKEQIIIDCTGGDEALLALALGWWPIPRVFASVSIGYKARRLFVFTACGHSFPMTEFRAALCPWLEREIRAWRDCGETIEGPGCWSPLFPARFDDVVLATSTAIKVIVHTYTTWPSSPSLTVFEQIEDAENGFVGYRRVSESEKP